MSRSSILLACLLIATPVLAAEPAGEAVKVLATTSIQGETGSHLLKARGPVYSGDLITTNDRGQAQLQFVDKTRMVVGPNAQVTIDDFVFAGRAKASAFTINAVRGAFRFISGTSNKQAYTINFPAGTIGVRGTEFDLTVERDGTSTIALYKGGLQVCDRSRPRRCAELTRSCTVLVLGPGEDFEWVRNVYEKTELMDEKLPYAFRQDGLRREMRVATGRCEVRQLTSPESDSNDDSDNSPPDVIIDID